MKTTKFLMPFLIVMALFTFSSCDNDDDSVTEMPEQVASKSFNLESVAIPGISGTATFIKNSDDTTTITIALENTPEDGMHPSHIHFNTASEGGGIALSLGMVDGSTGIGTITTNTLDDGTAITYEELLDFDGYINVHLSADDLGTIVAQGDIGQNELTGESKEYALDEAAVAGISGVLTFSERVNGEALATIALDGTPEDGMHPAHIHANTAAEGGGIIFTFNPVNGTTGISKTNVASLDDETTFGYSDVFDVDAYVNVHLSADDLGTIVAQGDIGQNELTGESKEYALDEAAVAGISGVLTFSERVNGEALATIALDGTPEDGMHPAHIHANTAAEGGGIIFTFNPVNGTTGISKTNVASLNDETAFGYSDVFDVDAYVNVHLSADDLGTIVARGDIGQNELTGISKSYPLTPVNIIGANGDITFFERINGSALAIFSLVGTVDNQMHPAHIHANDAETGGPIIFTFTDVDGATGVSTSQVEALDDGSPFGYEDVLVVDGYVNVHFNAETLETIVVQGNIGANE